jgi:hypothetical protein
MSAHTADHTGAATADVLRKVAKAVGVVFLLVGIAGFIPGLTSNLGDISFASHHSDATLLGLFQVSILHNVVHLLFGFAGLAAAKALGASRSYLIGGGLIYGALAVYGMIIDRMSDANFVPVNDADNWLHIGLAAAMIVLGLVLSPRTARA